MGSLLRYSIYSNGQIYVEHVFYKIRESSSAIISILRNDNSEIIFEDLSIEIPVAVSKNYYLFYLSQTNGYFNNLTFRFSYYYDNIIYIFYFRNSLTCTIMVLISSDVKITNGIFQNLKINLVTLFSAFYLISYEETCKMTIENTKFNNITSLNSYSNNYYGNSLFYFSEPSLFIFNNNTVENFSSNSYRIIYFI